MADGQDSTGEAAETEIKTTGDVEIEGAGSDDAAEDAGDDEGDDDGDDDGE